MQKNCKKMQIYLHISKKSSIFATDFNSGVHNNQERKRVMKNVCVCRIEVGGSLFRVIENPHPHCLGMYSYRIMHNRKCYGKTDDWNARTAIERAMELACGCHVTIDWEKRA